jgi:hypothetical protein
MDVPDDLGADVDIGGCVDGGRYRAIRAKHEVIILDGKSGSGIRDPESRVRVLDCGFRL